MLILIIKMVIFGALFKCIPSNNKLVLLPVYDI